MSSGASRSKEKGNLSFTEDASGLTPDFTVRQGYLDAARGRIDARYAWTVPVTEHLNVCVLH